MPIEDYEDVLPRIAPKLVARAKQGDRPAATRLLDIFRFLVACGREIPESILQYVAQAFDEILSGTSPAKALHLGGPAQRPRNPELAMRDLLCAMEFEELLGQGARWNEARDRVAKALHVSESVVERAVKKDRAERAALGLIDLETQSNAPRPRRRRKRRH
jgi:hypothetical protein